MLIDSSPIFAQLSLSTKQSGESRGNISDLVSLDGISGEVHLEANLGIVKGSHMGLGVLDHFLRDRLGHMESGHEGDGGIICADGIRANISKADGHEVAGLSGIGVINIVEEAAGLPLLVINAIKPLVNDRKQRA